MRERLPPGSAARPVRAVNVWPGRGRRWLLPWALVLAGLLNVAWPTYRHYDFSHSLDTRAYLRLAAGYYDSVSVTRRYRLLLPLAAGALARPLRALGTPATSSKTAGAPSASSPDEWARRLAFYLLNCLVLSAAAVCWLRAARLAGAGPLAAVVALAAVLSSRWAGYAAGLPLTDSLYLLVFGLSYYAARRGAGAGWAVALALALGPLSKESFGLLLPWLLWFGRRALGWRGQGAALAGGLLALGAAHVWVDSVAGNAPIESLTNALSHVENIAYSLSKLVSLKGLAELAGSFGLFWLPVLLLLTRRSGRARLAPVLGWPEAGLLVVVAAHVLLSADLGRMAFLLAPVFTASLALALTGIGEEGNRRIAAS